MDVTGIAIVDETELRLVEFQDRLHDTLQAFLNGDFVVSGSHAWELARRLSLKRRRVPRDILQPALDAAARVRGGGGADALPVSGRRHRWLTFPDAAVLLSEMHRQLDETLVDGGGPGRQIAIAGQYDQDRYERHRLPAVIRLAAYARRHLAPYLTSFLVHGSLSTWDYTPYSDLDDLLIVNRATLRDPQRLQECAAHCVAAARYLYEHDPLHHHRHYVITDLDLRAYPETYLPLEAIELATVVAGPARLIVHSRDGAPRARSALRNLAGGITAWSRRQPMNVWELKALVSSVLLLPALYLEVNGVYRYKRDTFEAAHSQLAQVWAAVEIAAQIRRAWNYRAGRRETVLRTLILRWLRNPPLYQHVIARWAPPIPPAMSRLVEETDFRPQAVALAREALRATQTPQGRRDADQA